MVFADLAESVVQEIVPDVGNVAMQLLEFLFCFEPVPAKFDFTVKTSIDWCFRQHSTMN